MTNSAYRYRWTAPRGGMALKVQYWSGEKGGGLEGVALPLKKPRMVIAPAQLDDCEDREIEPTPKERAELVRAIERVDPSNAASLVDFMSTWGFLSGSPVSAKGRFRNLPGDFSDSFCDPEDPIPTTSFRLPEDADLVPYMKVSSARSDVSIYQAAVGRFADLREKRGAARRKAEDELRASVLDQLNAHGTAERDPETFLPLIGSPMCTAWQRLAESAVLGQLPVLCKNDACKRPFSLAETDKRSDAPPKYCSGACKQAAYNKRKKTASKRTKKPTPGRK